jgi:hypothetical protein
MLFSFFKFQPNGFADMVTVVHFIFVPHSSFSQRWSRFYRASEAQFSCRFPLEIGARQSRQQVWQLEILLTAQDQYQPLQQFDKSRLAQKKASEP